MASGEPADSQRVPCDFSSPSEDIIQTVSCCMGMFSLPVCFNPLDLPLSLLHAPKTVNTLSLGAYLIRKYSCMNCPSPQALSKGLLDCIGLLSTPSSLTLSKAQAFKMMDKAGSCESCWEAGVGWECRTLTQHVPEQKLLVLTEP